MISKMWNKSFQGNTSLLNLTYCILCKDQVDLNESTQLMGFSYLSLKTILALVTFYESLLTILFNHSEAKGILVQ